MPDGQPTTKNHWLSLPLTNDLGYMDQMITRFPAQLLEALEIGERADIIGHDHAIHHVFVAGMGGSGIGANFVQSIVSQECTVPITVGKDYTVPTFVNEHTLVILSSYSGNTEEVLFVFDHVIKTNCKIVCVASGGKLHQLALEHNLDFIKLPTGWSSPRACLGYSFVQQLFILNKLNLIQETFSDKIKKAVDSLTANRNEIQSNAQDIANRIHNKIPIIYSSTQFEPAAIRLRQQLNENSKMLCWHHAIPEMNHNELVGWKFNEEDMSVILFRSALDSKRNDLRLDISTEIIRPLCHDLLVIQGVGGSKVEQLLYFVHLGDWISWYTAQLRRVDAIEIDAIIKLKTALAKN